MLSREEVAANQRERLMEAMIGLVGERGYTATTVSELVARAGVSRKAFYEQYANKEECFLATYDAIVGDNLARVASAVDDAGDLRERESAGLGMLFERLTHRERARLILVEASAAGPEGIARREGVLSAYETLFRENLGAPARPGLIPNPLLRAIVGGLLRVLYTRVQSGAHAKLQSLTADLVAWSFSYHPLPGAMEAIGELHPTLPPPAFRGGRAPGTLSPVSTSTRRRSATRRTPSVSPSFVAHSQRERILDAIAQLSAEKGYGMVTVEDIAERASVSLHAFYQHFADKEDAFLVAYEVGHGKALAIVERAHDAAPDWPSAVRAGIEALFDFLASEEAFAHLALVDALIATPRTSERSMKGTLPFIRLLAGGLQGPKKARPPHVTIEAIGGGIFELCLAYTVQGHVSELSEQLPWATFFALAPFIGAEEAGRVATRD
jgi:AcrR family transcriptional regulator